MGLGSPLALAVSFFGISLTFARAEPYVDALRSFNSYNPMYDVNNGEHIALNPRDAIPVLRTTAADYTHYIIRVETGRCEASYELTLEGK